MKASVKFKICVDIMMTAALYACMAYMLVGEEAHEWIGSGLALLFVLHNALNRKWYAALLTGRYTPLRAFQTAVNLLCLVSVAAAAASGAAMSRYLYDIPFLSSGASLARTVHMLSAYWGYCFISLHLGLHWSMMLGMMKNAAAPQRAPSMDYAASSNGGSRRRPARRARAHAPQPARLHVPAKSVRLLRHRAPALSLLPRLRRNNGALGVARPLRAACADKNVGAEGKIKSKTTH